MTGDMRGLPEAVKEIAGRHVRLLEEALPGYLEAYYVVGSAALGAFDERHSDIDFIAVVKRQADSSDLPALKKLHRALKNLDGMYLLWEDLRSLEDGGIPCLRFNEGSYLGTASFKRDSADAFVLKKHGIALLSRGREGLSYTVDMDALQRGMRENLDTYWRRWVAGCRRMSSQKFWALLFSLRAVEWGVLGVSRLYYTLREGDITSKRGAGDYALKTLPARWHRILREAMRQRERNRTSYYRSALGRRKDALAYMEYIIGGYAEDSSAEHGGDFHRQ